jgi:hypothetical protein
MPDGLGHGSNYAHACSNRDDWRATVGWGRVSLRCHTETSPPHLDEGVVSVFEE